jgi:hypothetical protein
MNPYQFLREIAGIPTGSAQGGLGGGDGIRHEIQLSPPAVLRTAAGLVLTAITTPAVVAAETNAIVVQAVASSNVLGSFTLSVPKDYDPAKDELSLRIIAQTSGTTDAPTLNASVFRKRAGVVLSSALTTVASAAVPNNTAKGGEVIVDISNNVCLPDDVLFVNITSGAHTTDAINIYGCDILYRSNIVLTDMASR